MQQTQVSTTDSILDSVKKKLGIASDYTEFDTDIIIDINTILASLVQMGIGPQSGYAITSRDNIWDEFLDSDKKLNMVLTYVYLRVRLLFDPPQSGTLINSINAQIKEFEWRAYVEKGGY